MSRGMMIFALIAVSSILFAGAVIVRRRRRLRHASLAILNILQQWEKEQTTTPNSRVRLSLRTASSVVAAGRYQDALNVLEWLWTTDGLPISAELCGVRATAIVHRAKGENDIAQTVEQWADELSEMK